MKIDDSTEIPLKKDQFIDSEGDICVKLKWLNDSFEKDFWLESPKRAPIDVDMQIIDSKTE